MKVWLLMSRWKSDHLIHGVIGGIQGDAGQLGQAGGAAADVFKGMEVVFVLGAQALGAFGGRQAQGDDIGRVLVPVIPRLLWPPTRWVQRLALAVPHEECADALGGVDLVAGNGQRVHAGPLSAGRWGCAAKLAPRSTWKWGRLGCFSLDALGQGSNVLTCAGFVVDGHAGGQDGVFIHSSKEFFSVDMTVPLRGDFHDGEALLF